MQFDNVIIFAYQVATSRNFFNRVTLPKTASFQNMTEAAIKLMAARFCALGEVSRLKLISAVGNGEKNVSQLIAATGLSQANVSKHLKILTDSGIFARRKQGIYVFYSTTDSSVFKLFKD
jgi:ArsR family transcriptional regulator